MKPSIDPGKPKYCDMVMKGGITSGVVYPTAICELAGQYQFRNIGGASAGAIAAAAAAAAEFGRQNGVSDSFAQLGKLPSEFGSPGFLPGLFTPRWRDTFCVQDVPRSARGKAWASKGSPPCDGLTGSVLG
jgi:hypothetical protein